MKKIISGILIASLLIGSPLTVFAKAEESTDSSVLESSSETPTSNAAVSESTLQSSTTKTTQSTIKDTTKQSETISSTAEDTVSSSSESLVSSTDNPVKTGKAANARKSLAKAATQELSTDFLDRTKRFSENQFQNVAEIQDWLNTYDIFSIRGAQIVNYGFTGSIAIANGGLSVKNAAVKIEDSAKANYGSIINGPIYVLNNTVDFSNVSLEKGVYSDYSLENQGEDYNSNPPRPSGTGQIAGLMSDTQSKVKSFSTILQGKGLGISDFSNANINQSQYLANLGIKDSYPIPGDIKKDSKYKIANQTNTYVYNLNLANSEFPSYLNFNGFTGDDVVVVNVYDNDGTIKIGGGYNLNGANVIWNFPSAKNINNTTKFPGKIIAPYASVITNQPLDGGSFLQFGFGDSSTIEKGNITSESVVNVAQNADIADGKIYVTSITDHNGVTYRRDTADISEKTKFNSELKKVTTTYLGTDHKPLTNQQKIDTSKPGDIYIRYTYDGNLTLTSETKIVVKEQEQEEFKLAEVPNLKFESIRLGNSNVLNLKGFEIESSTKNDGTAQGIVKIIDTRKTSNWKLTLKLGKFMTVSGSPVSDSVAGNLHLALKNGTIEANLNAISEINPAENVGIIDKETKTYNIDTDKSKLELGKINHIGTYQGEVTWNLSDTVQ